MTPTKRYSPESSGHPQLTRIHGNGLVELQSSELMFPSHQTLHIAAGDTVVWIWSVIVEYSLAAAVTRLFANPFIHLRSP